MDTVFGRSLLGTLSLAPSYVYWHYAKATKHIWRLAADFSWFFWHFFSIGLLSRTFFKPWWRENERGGFSFAMFFSGEALENYFSAKTMNIIVTMFGVVVRSIVIVVGLAAEALLWIAAALFFIIWLILPVLVLYFVFAGIVFIAKPL